MFPIRDTRQSSTFPFFNYAIIALNLAIFIYQISLTNFDVFIARFAFIPQSFNFTHPQSYLPVVTSLFLHAGWLHILSNMWFLHIFGDNIEGALGHIRYLLFYLICGAVAVFTQYLFFPQSPIPLIGASGAIAGVTGAYFALFKRAKIEALVPTLFGLWDIVSLPAWIFLGYWFVLQIFSGVGSLVSIDTAGGGVAFFAHIGGFVVGYLLVTILRPKLSHWSYNE